MITSTSESPQQSSPTSSGGRTPARRAGGLLLAGLLLAFWPAGPLRAQITTSIFDGATPPAVEAGAPAGSYALSGFETVNLYSGQLDFALPLLRIGGRGEAGYTMTLRVHHTWKIETEWLCGTTNCDTANTRVPRHSAVPMQDPSEFVVGYGPGLLTSRTGTRTLQTCNPDDADCHLCTSEPYTKEEVKLTRYTFTGPDGAATELRDEKTEGEPFINTQAVDCQDQPPTAHPHRGRKFVAGDGSGAVFAADEVENEDNWFADHPTNTGTAALGPTGNLAFRNGTVYRIELGRVTSIRDRNGNQVSFAYNNNNGMVSQVTDSLGRVVNIAYDQRCGDGTTTCDKITYTGSGQSSRVIEVHYNTLDNLLCNVSGDDNCPGPTDPLIAGSGVRTYDGLFPPGEKGGRDIPHTTVFNPDDVVAAVKLPNDTFYRFQYNVYRELYRVTLPTGGVIEYDTGPGITTPACSGRWCPSATAGLIDIGSTLMIYRRVSERREKPSASATETGSRTFAFQTASGSTDCQPGLTVGNWCTEVTVKSYDGSPSGTQLSDERHHFYGSPIYPLQAAPWEYPYWRTGKEYKTEIKPSRGAVLRRTDNVWEQRAQPAWWTSPTAPNPPASANNHTADNAPPNDVRLASSDTTVDGTFVSQVAYSYSNDRFNNRTDVKRYDYGGGRPGNLLTWLHTEYETASAYTQSGANFDAIENDGGAVLKTYLPSVVTKEWLCGERSSSCPESSAVAKNEFEIDHNALVGRSGISGHDSSGFGAGYTVRGNRTQLRRWLNPGNTEITQTLTYDIAGNVTRVRDFNNIPTTISYTDCFTSGLPPSPTFAFPTTITRDDGGLDHEIRFCYDYHIGRQTEASDENDFTTEFAYADLLDRPTQITDPLSATTDFSYDDTNRIITTTRQQDSCGSSSDDIVSKVVFDGFGRQVRAEQHEDGSACIATIQTYDGLGRVEEVGNPQREGSCDSTDLDLPPNTTEYEYDALGRITRIIYPDGSTATNRYFSHITVHLDPANNERQVTRDALDRITQVSEDPFGLRYSTNYDHDALGNLTSVRQGSQTRTFGYDSLGRLVCASNPESRVGSAACNTSTLPTSGVDRYSYDNNSNLTAQTDARGVTVTTSYDHLNRPTAISYSDSTPDVTLCYDGADFDGSACTGSQVAGEKGQLTAAGSAVSTTRYESFNQRGQVIGSSQQTGGSTYSFSYSYNQAGGLETQQYPSSLLVETCYDSAGRIKEVSSTGTAPATYGSEFGYAPHGALAELKLGNNLYEYRDYNNRLQPREIGLGTFSGGSDKLKLRFTYGTSRNNNGNVLKQIITRPSLSALTQSYDYDDVNRLISAAESGAGTAFSRSYGYDRYGNRAVSANSGLPTSPLMPTSTSNFSTATNRLTLSGAAYDNAGNLTATGLGEALAYDAENRLTSYTLSSATSSYKYGPQGRRVQKVTPTVTETYIYDAFGKLAAEYSTASPASGGTFYRTPDHLGSTRLVTRQDKSDAACYDYAPFGEEIPDTLGDRSSNSCFAASFDGRHRFTGKERDSESDLDYFLARYYSGPMGRFLSVDPENAGADPAFPQTWNAYAYVNNNPLKYVDPDGRVVFTAAALAYLAFEVVSTAIDVVNAVQTVRDPNATTTEKAVAVAGAVAGLALPGPTGTGATAVAKGVRTASNALDAASDSSKALRTADAAADATKGGTYKLVDSNGKVRRTGMTNNLERRRKEHQRGKETEGLDFVIDTKSDDPIARRGREQILYDENPKADLNRRRPISPKNPRLEEYLEEGRKLKPEL